MRIVSAAGFLVKRDNPIRLPFVRHLGMKLVNLFINENTELYKLPSSLRIRQSLHGLAPW